MGSTNNPSFAHGNWNRGSASNILLGKGFPNKKLKCKSHEDPMPIISSRVGSFYYGQTDNNNGQQNGIAEEKFYQTSFDSSSGSQVNSSSNDSNDLSPFMGTRFGFQYRSNPQISFSSSLEHSTTGTAGGDFDTLSTTYDKSSCNPVRLAVTRNSNRNKQRAGDSYHNGGGLSGQQQIQKWKNELSAVPRKWCDFVFRRNEDNKVYRSESFRFIQKTNSLALLAPNSSAGGLHGHRNKRISYHGVSVSDDYVDPVDHVINLSVPQRNNNLVIQGAWSASSRSGDTSSGSRKSGITSSEATSTSTNLCGEDEGEEPPYHEIAERYNAPYYYSDTIKEPTYINPCEDEDVQSAACSSLSNASSPSPVLSESLEPVTVTIITANLDKPGEKEQERYTRHRVLPAGARKQNKLNRRSAYLRGSRRELMARKRYETAFLPSSSPHASSQTTPDIDSLLLAIESSCHLGQGYVSKTDILQPKTSCDDVDDLDVDEPTSGSFAKNNEGIVRNERYEGYERREPYSDGGVEERVIYINHPSSRNPSSPPGTYEHAIKYRHQLPVSSSPLPPATCLPDASVMAAGSSSSHSQFGESYRGSPVLDASEITRSNASLETNPSTSYCQSHHFQHHHHPHHVHQNLNINLIPNRSPGLCSTTNCSPLANHKVASKPMMPLSEPLPQKKYISKINSSSAHHAPVSTSSTAGPGETRRLGHNLKDNSVSSLESIDSTKSEELSSSLHRQSSNCAVHHASGHYQPQKLLSPISDKSPLEPGTQLTGNNHKECDENQENNQSRASSKWSNTPNVLDAAELTNVPWEMPKLRRKLARLADSGISLDFAGSSSKESDCAPALSYLSGNVGTARASLDLSLGGHNQGALQGQSKRESATAHSSLQLSFDDGLTRDEYYEDPSSTSHEEVIGVGTSHAPSRQGFLTASKIPGSAIVEDVTAVQVHVSEPQVKVSSSTRPDRCRMKLDFSAGGLGGRFLLPDPASVIDPSIELERQDWFHGAITRCDAENILRATKEGSFLVRNCESTTFNRYSLSLKSFRGCIHIRIEPNSLGTFSLGDQEFPSVPHLVLHFMSHRLPIKGAEHVRLMYPVITQLL